MTAESSFGTLIQQQISLVKHLEKRIDSPVVWPIPTKSLLHYLLYREILIFLGGCECNTEDRWVCQGVFDTTWQGTCFIFFLERLKLKTILSFSLGELSISNIPEKVDGSRSKLLNRYTNKLEQIWLILKGILHEQEYVKFLFSLEMSLVVVCIKKVSDFFKALDYVLSHRLTFTSVNKNVMTK